MTLINDINSREYNKFDDENRVKTVLANTLITDSFDYIGATYPDTETEVYTYKSGGSSGTVVGTITVVYTDSTKAVLSSVTKS